MKMSKSFTLAVFAMAISSCAYITAKGTEPKFTWLVKGNLNDMASCLVSELDTEWKARSFLETSFTHKIDVISPDKIYEVTHQQTIVVGGGPCYYVEVEQKLDSVSVKQYSIRAFTERTQKAVQKCVSK